MTEHERDEQLIAERSHLLPEEETAGSDNPMRQAQAILAESEERTNDPQGTQEESPQTPGS